MIAHINDSNFFKKFKWDCFAKSLYFLLLIFFNLVLQIIQTLITFIGLAKLVNKILRYGLPSRFLIQLIIHFLIFFKNLLLLLFKSVISFLLNLFKLLQVLIKAHPSLVKLDICFRSLHLRDLYNIPRCFKNLLTRLILHGILWLWLIKIFCSVNNLNYWFFRLLKDGVLLLVVSTFETCFTEFLLLELAMLKVYLITSQVW